MVAIAYERWLSHFDSSSFPVCKRRTMYYFIVICLRRIFFCDDCIIERSNSLCIINSAFNKS
jgi:hypothetical protein